MLKLPGSSALVDVAHGDMAVQIMTYKLRFLFALVCLASFWSYESLAIEKLPAAKQTITSRPNFIVVTTDDQRWDGAGFNNLSQVDTPGLDRLASRGLQFTDAHVALSLCSPSRAAILTGQYGSRNGVIELGGALAKPENSVACILRNAGYATAISGKWHLKTTPEEAGFSWAVTFQANGAWYGRAVNRNGKQVKPNELVDAYCAKESVRFLRERNPQQPFFLWHCTQLPHMAKNSWPVTEASRAHYADRPVTVPKSWNDGLENKPAYISKSRNRTQALEYCYDNPARIEAHIRDYRAAMTELDSALAPLWQELDKQGLWENTFVIFLSDNGWFLGEHGLTSKVIPYAPSTRIPFLIAGPGVKAGHAPQLVSNLDVAPTLLQLAGLPVADNIQGQSLMPFLGGRIPANWRKSFLYEGLATYGGVKPNGAIISKDWNVILTWDKEAAVGKPFIEAYHRTEDSEELNNQATVPERKSIVEQATKTLQQHFEAAKGITEPSHLEHPQWSGIYPHLAMFNDDGECGTGSVVPWADRLWAITYSPHRPNGSTDKLYEITPDLQQIIRPESIGGTPANRFIHRESQQLFIGSYAIDAHGAVRVIPTAKMPGRLTGTARHLIEPTNKIYYATMEHGFYEVDVNTLAETQLWPDESVHQTNGSEKGLYVDIPGAHGKGLYSGQGQLIFANNGERSPEAKTNPATPAGALAEWDGKSKSWVVVRRNQFTEVTGPGGLQGNAKPETDPVWSIGWDDRSLILMLLDGGKWTSFRLPKGSHSYDGAHGWNTEWPRIRDIGEPDNLMTMHGMFWRFPKTFSLTNIAGIVPRSSYLKVIGDFCRWNDRIVLGCDDTARNEFLNQRKAKGKLAGPGQSQSNLQFLAPEELDHLGPPIGRGAVWINNAVRAGEVSEPFLFAGFARRAVHLAHDSKSPVTFTIEVDRQGNGQWRKLRDVKVSATGYSWSDFSPNEQGAWVRLRVNRDCVATAFFNYSSADVRTKTAASFCDGLATFADENFSGGIITTRGDNLRTLAFAATSVRDGKPASEGYYELDSNMHLRRVNDAKTHEWTKKNIAVPAGVLKSDAASVLFVDDAGRRWRLPKGDAGFDAEAPLPLRVDREVCTERDLFNAHGTFYELPAENAGGFAKIRPITTHNRRITDYCSYRGLLVLTGIRAEAPAKNSHIIRSDDGQCAVWAGAVDDLWKFGKAVGVGGPWKQTTVRAGEISDAYLMTGYDRKTLTLAHNASEPVKMRIEVDITGNGDWKTYRTFDVPKHKDFTHKFPESFQAYWVRVTADRDCAATALFVYE